MALPSISLPDPSREFICPLVLDGSLYDILKVAVAVVVVLRELWVEGWMKVDERAVASEDVGTVWTGVIYCSPLQENTCRATLLRR